MLGHVRCNYCCMNYSLYWLTHVMGLLRKMTLKGTPGKDVSWPDWVDMKSILSCCISHLETLGMMSFLKVLHAGVQNGWEQFGWIHVRIYTHMHACTHAHHHHYHHATLHTYTTVTTHTPYHTQSDIHTPHTHTHIHTHMNGNYYIILIIYRVTYIHHTHTHTHSQSHMNGNYYIILII